MAKRILIVDDEPSLALFVSRVAESCGYEVRTAGNAAVFREVYRSFQPDVIALDLAMPEVDGIELLGFLADAGCRAQLLIVSGFDASIQRSAERLGEARGLRMAGILTKPLRAQRLRTVLEELASDEASGDMTRAKRS